MPTPVKRRAIEAFESNRPDDDGAFAGTAAAYSSPTAARAAGRHRPPQDAPKRFQDLPGEIRLKIIAGAMEDALKPDPVKLGMGVDQDWGTMMECWRNRHETSTASDVGIIDAAQWALKSRWTSHSFKADVEAAVRLEPAVGLEMTDMILRSRKHSEDDVSTDVFETKMKDAIEYGVVNINLANLSDANIEIAFRMIGETQQPLRQVQVYCGQYSPPTRLFERLVKTQAWSKVTRIDLRESEIDAAEVEAIGNNLQASGLTELILLGIPLDQAASKALADGIRSSKLRALKLPDCNFDPEAAITLANNLPLSEITDLELLDNPIGNAAGRAIGDVLPGTRLIGLDLGNTGIESEAAVAIGNNLRKSSLQCLVLLGNDLGNVGISSIAEGLSGSDLTVLDISFCEADQQDAKAIAESLSKSSLVCLNLDNNELGNDGVEIVLDAVSASRLKVLSLNSVEIDRGVGPALKKFLSDSKMPLIVLELGNNNIHEDITDLALGLRNSSLKNLNLISCRMTDDDFEKITAEIPASTLSSLNVWGNKISDAALERFSFCIEKSQLTELIFNAQISGDFHDGSNRTRKINPAVVDLLLSKLDDNKRRLDQIAAAEGRI